MRLLIWARGILFHSSSKASRSSVTLPGGFWRCRTRVSRLSQRCSMGFRSGLFEGQSSMKSILLFCKNWILSQATWGLALSCWNTEIMPWCCKRGTMCGARTRSLYFWAREWPQKIFHDQSPQKNVADLCRGWTCNLLVSSRTAHPNEPPRPTGDYFICLNIERCHSYTHNAPWQAILI